MSGGMGRLLACWSWVMLFCRRWMRNGLTDSAAAIAFYSLISLVPLLLIGVTVASMVLGEQAAQGELTKQLESVMGEKPAGFLESVIESSRVLSRGASVTSAVAFVVLLFSGSHVLSKLHSTLNEINGVTRKDPARPVLGSLFARGVSSLLILLFGALLVIGTLAQSFVARFAEQVSGSFLEGWHVVRWYDRFSSYLLLAVGFLVVLKLLPRRRPLWRHALPGAVLAAVAVGSLKSGLQFYLGYSVLASAFGAGVTVLVFFLWLLLSIQAFLGGALLSAMLGEGELVSVSDNLLG